MDLLDLLAVDDRGDTTFVSAYAARPMPTLPLTPQPPPWHLVQALAAHVRYAHRVGALDSTNLSSGSIDAGHPVALRELAYDIIPAWATDQRVRIHQQHATTILAVLAISEDHACARVLPGHAKPEQRAAVRKLDPAFLSDLTALRSYTLSLTFTTCGAR